MNRPIVISDEPVLLVGGGDSDNLPVRDLLTMCPVAVGADSGADRLRAAGRVADALIGDLDSVSEATRRAMPAEAVHHIAEQDSTDFDKCLRNIEAPLILGAGFLGSRVDHMLAVLTVLARHPHKTCVLLGDRDVIAHLPPRLALDLATGMRLSLFPMSSVTGRSEGLEWPIDGVVFTPDGRVGTSNRVTGPVRLWMDGPGMLLILPVSEWRALAAALRRSGDRWPAP